MKQILPALALLLAFPAHAQELTLFGGGVKQAGTKESSAAWALEYQHGLGENLAASFSWLNEGHFPGHHRDGQAVQIWGRTNVLDRRLSLAAGIGPYRYFNTVDAAAASGYANVHGWGTIGSLAATYYTDSPWLWSLRANRIVTPNSIDTSSLMFGVGYQLEPVAGRGPISTAPYQAHKTTSNEITLFFGRTIVNSYSSEEDHTGAFAIEYRHGLARHVDVSVSYIDEGSTALLRRSGVAAQLWGVREFLASDRLSMGIGFGPYLSIDTDHAPGPGEGGASKYSWMFSATASYRFGRHWDARFSWNRIATNYNRDTDLLLFGAGYRF